MPLPGRRSETLDPGLARLVSARGWAPVETASHGAIATVLLARHEPSGRAGFFKVARRGEDAAWFHQEAALLSAVAHPRLPALLDQGELADGRPFLVTAPAPGELLSSRLRRGPLGPAAAARAARDVASALSALHRAGAVHRDVAPSNVVLFPRGSTAHATLIDLGSARWPAFGPDPAERRGLLVGTPLYAAPELFARPGAAGPASDLYSLGACLFESIAGEPPFAPAPLEALLASRPTAIAPALGSIEPSAPPPLASLADALLSLEPRARPASADEVVAAIDALVEGLGPQALADDEARAGVRASPGELLLAAEPAGAGPEGLVEMRSRDGAGAVTLLVVPADLVSPSACARVEAMRYLLRRPLEGFVAIVDEIDLPSGATALARRDPVPPLLDGRPLAPGLALAVACSAAAALGRLYARGRRFDGLGPGSIRATVGDAADAGAFRCLMEPPVVLAAGPLARTAGAPSPSAGPFSPPWAGEGRPEAGWASYAAGTLLDLLLSGSTPAGQAARRPGSPRWPRPIADLCSFLRSPGAASAGAAERALLEALSAEPPWQAAALRAGR